MRFLEWFFLESTPALAITLGLLGFWLLVRWRRRGSGPPLRFAVVAIAALLVQAWVVTPLEGARAILFRLERSIESAGTSALRDTLSIDFRAADWGRDEFIAVVSEMLRGVHVSSAGRSALEIRDRASGRLTLVARYVTHLQVDGTAGMLESAWEIRFARSDGHWRIVGIDPLRINRRTITDWRQLRQLR